MTMDGQTKRWEIWSGHGADMTMSKYPYIEPDEQASGCEHLTGTNHPPHTNGEAHDHTDLHFHARGRYEH